MELDSILKIIDRISASEISDFQYEEGNLKVSLKKEKSQVYVTGTQPQALEAMASGEVSTEKKIQGGNLMKAPLVGTFYNTPSPEEPPFVKPGDMVKKGQVLGIIEAMKLMNEIESEFDGIVEEVLVENEAMVEYGQPLFRIR